MTDIQHHMEMRSAEAKQVTLVGAVLNLVLSVLKVAVGIWAHSQALVADGIHSLSDLFSDAIVWFAAHQGSDAPDKEHPYGHGRFETLATLFLGLLLLIVAVGIAWDAIDRLFDPTELMIPGVAALIVALSSILSKEWLYQYTVRVAKKTRSKMLLANAWHHRSDAVSSIVVLVGIAGVMAGLDYLDAIAAVVVSVMIGKMGVELGWEAMQELADKGLDPSRINEIRQWILNVGGVRDVHMLRTRSLGGAASVDVHVLVHPFISVSEGHLISVLVENGLKKTFEEIMDVTVHIDPEDDEVIPAGPLPPQRSRIEADLAACAEGIVPTPTSKDLVMHYLKGRVHVEWEVGDFPIQEAELRDRLGSLDYLGSLKIVRTKLVHTGNK